MCLAEQHIFHPGYRLLGPLNQLGIKDQPHHAQNTPATPWGDNIFRCKGQGSQHSPSTQLKYPEQKPQFFSILQSHHDWIRAIVAYHLNISISACQVADSGDWIHRSCNICIPVAVSGINPALQPGNRVLVRFSLPYRVGEFSKPGNSDEKVRCKPGTYAFLEENFPDTPISRLYGFGMGTGETINHSPA